MYVHNIRRALSLCLLAVVACLQLTSSIAVPEDSAGAGMLGPDSAVTGLVSSSRTNSHLINVVAGQLVRVEVLPESADLLISIEGPDQKSTGKWYLSRGFAQPVAWIPKISGICKLEVSIQRGTYTDQPYSLVVTQRTAVENDRRLIAGSQNLSAAVRLHGEYNRRSLLDAIGEYRKALGLLSNSLLRGYILCQMGDIYKLFSEQASALNAYHRAIEMAGNSSLKIRALNAIGNVRLKGGEHRAAKKCFDEALAMSRSGRNRRLEAESMAYLGYLCYLENNADAALVHLKASLAISESLGDRLAMAETQLILGYVHHSVKDLKKAQEFYRQSFRIGLETKEPGMEALARLAIGHVMVVTGEWQKAFRYYDRAQLLFERTGDQASRNSVLQGKAYAYHAMGEKASALTLYRELAMKSRELNDTHLETNTLFLVAEIYQEMGDLDNALLHCNLALRTNKDRPDPYVKACVFAIMGKIYEAKGNVHRAQIYYQKALNLGKKSGDPFVEGMLLNAMGQSYLGMGEHQSALQWLSNARNLQESAGDVVNLPTTLYNLARLHHAMGEPDAALDYINQAIRSTESLRVKVAGQQFRASFTASVNQIHKYAIELLMQLHRAQPDSGWDSAALQANERARARSLLESLHERGAEVRQGVSPELLEQESRLNQNLNDKSELLANGQNEAENATLSREIKEIITETQRVQALILGQSPHYASLTQPQPLNVHEIREEVLDPDTLLLEYSLGEKESYLWAVGSESINSFRLPKRSEIEKRVRSVMNSMLARQNHPNENASGYLKRIHESDRAFCERAYALSNLLLGPAAHLFGKRRLAIVAEGDLQHLPFAALPMPGSRTNARTPDQSFAPLIMDHEIVYLPSASVLGILRREMRDREVPSKMIAVFADPVFADDDPRVLKSPTIKQNPDLQAAGKPEQLSANTLNIAPKSTSIKNKALSLVRRRDGFGLSRLPHTRNEADAILALTSPDFSFSAFDFDASRANVMNAPLHEYRVVHFATHGILNSKYPELSGLALSLLDAQGERQANRGVLRLSDIYNLNLPVQLVVLSACDTGLGVDIRGEGLVGIVRGFMYSGAARVAASLWKVEDEATSELMQRFYRHMFQKGEPASAALRAAQLEMFQQKRWNAPYFWGAFMVQGEWR